MRYRLWLLVFVILAGSGLVKPEPAIAWGRYGHLSVCDLAYRNFTPATQVAVNVLLQSRSGEILVKGRGRMADRRYTSFNLGCLEEDALPRRHAEDYFINVARSVPAIHSDQCPTGGECIVAGIARDLAILKDSSLPREKRVFALMALGHWLGDIHQSLHISYADDRGGNGIEAKLTAKCGTSSYRVENLHAVWDNCLLEAGWFERVRKRADFRKSWGPNTVTYRAVDTLQTNTTLAQEQEMVIGEPWQWAQESYAITRDPSISYCVLSGGNCRYSPVQDILTSSGPKRLQPISQAYLAAYVPVAETRIRLAGFRLAQLINSALDPSYSGPVRDFTQAS